MMMNDISILNVEISRLFTTARNACRKMFNFHQPLSTNISIIISILHIACMHKNVVQLARTDDSVKKTADLIASGRPRADTTQSAFQRLVLCKSFKTCFYHHHHHQLTTITWHEAKQPHIYTHTHTHIYIYLYINTRKHTPLNIRTLVSNQLATTS
ncbi:conserved hypothetical protein [Trichinella spiralis]|uniref:hypothetical protein n=1 Tax=Trichinella spiralis TaxID=6334 RepID=UPI0001EFB71F|nr:conserved hypothetical protein [Trichinella spiralis]